MYDDATRPTPATVRLLEDYTTPSREGPSREGRGAGFVAAAPRFWAGLTLILLLLRGDEVPSSSTRLEGMALRN